MRRCEEVKAAFCWEQKGPKELFMHMFSASPGERGPGIPVGVKGELSVQVLLQKV